MSRYTPGDRVEWDWGRGTVTGYVVSVHTERVVRMLKGSRITRNGTPENPALYIETTEGAGVLKLSSEVRLT